LATGGGGGSNTLGQGPDSVGGDAFASSTARTTGSGDALSSANATGGDGGSGVGGGPYEPGGNATAVADASATGGGKAIATAIAAQGLPTGFPVPPTTANATSNAETTNGAMAEAVSGVGGTGVAESSAKTGLAGVSAQSTITAPSSSISIPADPTADAIAQGGSAPAFSIYAPNFAFSTVLTDKTYAATLIDSFGGASNVADALLGPQDEIFGTANQNVGTATSTFDFRFQGDLLLGVIEGSDFDIAVNGAEIFTGGSVTNTVFDLGSNFGPNIDLTINGFGAFVIGSVVPEAVPEPPTWAMMLVGFAGLGVAGWRGSRKIAAHAA
jgi:hypothetical protein